MRLFRLAMALTVATVATTYAHHPQTTYTPGEMWIGRGGPWIGFHEQFSRLATLQEDGDEVSNPSDERLESSVTQLILGYSPLSRLGVQLNLPIVNHRFRRLEGENVVRGDETGIGDLSLLGSAVAWNRSGPESLFRLSLLAGVKFPTGDTDRLREELDEHHADPADEHGHDHDHGPPLHHESGVHGHDLTLGSGSFDGLFGGRAFFRWRRFFARASLEYALRTEGDFDYDFANELTWAGGPGVYLLSGRDRTVGIEAIVSGTTKGKDTLDGRRLDDTGATHLFVGPGIFLTWGEHLGAEVAGDLPVHRHTSALQIVPDFRVRGGITWWFSP